MRRKTWAASVNSENSDGEDTETDNTTTLTDESDTASDSLRSANDEEVQPPTQVVQTPPQCSTSVVYTGKNKHICSADRQPPRLRQKAH